MFVIDDVLMGAAITGGAGLIGGILGNDSREQIANDANIASASQAQRQMDFQERMSGSSYQRAVKDMEAAGLNPMLAYSQGGASTPSGAMGAVVQPQYVNPVDSAVQAAGGYFSAANIMAQTEKTQAEADILKSKVPYANESAELDLLMKRGDFVVNKYAADVAERANLEGMPKLLVEKFRSEMDSIKQSVKTAKSVEDWNRIRERLDQLEVPKSLAFSNFFKTAFGKAVPSLEAGGQLLNSAGAVLSRGRAAFGRR